MEKNKVFVIPEKSIDDFQIRIKLSSAVWSRIVIDSCRRHFKEFMPPILPFYAIYQPPRTLTRTQFTAEVHNFSLFTLQRLPWSNYHDA
ncbi:hypothetical protein TNCT_210441 [Trichonephila clavata]|uniref:Uncharacterized protein n=1 Tax=Trichonephila clavata TaxID=2740835 RepID=A0A8X6J9L1_TRICU|nr:hypothetical protein TNCT_210441 [Trichonephila clavata]